MTGMAGTLPRGYLFPLLLPLLLPLLPPLLLPLLLLLLLLPPLLLLLLLLLLPPLLLLLLPPLLPPPPSEALLPILLNTVEVLPPSAFSASMATMATRAMITAYSTRACPEILRSLPSGSRCLESRIISPFFPFGLNVVEIMGW